MMNKAKALFTAGMIVIVAGASSVCWYLNDKGIIGADSETVDSHEDYIVVDDYNNDNNNYNNKKSSEKKDSDNENNEQLQETTESTTVNTDEKAKDDNNENEVENVQSSVNLTALNEFLSKFSKLYFSENSRYSAAHADTYELLKFAYLYDVVYNDGKSTVTEYMDDDIGAYNGINATVAQDIIDNFFGVEIACESVYTEKPYTFFKYSDGYFYTPAADGVGYSNITIADSISQDGDSITVVFTVYSAGANCDMTAEEAKKNGEIYASGKATVRVDGENYKLESYSVNK